MKKILIIAMMAALVLAACDTVAGPTGDTASDIEAAGNYLPNIAGFNKQNADNLVNTISGMAGGSALMTGNVALAGAIAKIDDVIQCYQDVGAVAASIYTPASLGRITGIEAGVVAVINEDRIKDNFLACLAGQRGDTTGAQDAVIEPCTGSGNFTINGDTLYYIYAGTQPSICATFEQHFTNVKQNQSG